MIEAICVRVRYDTLDENKKTRRERNEAFGETYSPPLVVPQNGRYLWNWYFELSESIRRVRDGVCEPIPPSEFVAWTIASGNIVYSGEYAILRAMDRAYCDEMNIELTDYSIRRKEAMQNEIDAFRKVG